jgi:hypothetical protein
MQRTPGTMAPGTFYGDSHGLLQPPADVPTTRANEITRSECSLVRKAELRNAPNDPLVCSRPEQLQTMRQVISQEARGLSQSDILGLNDVEVVRVASKLLGCESESCVTYQPQFVKASGMEASALREMRNMSFMAEGPFDSEAQLANTEIMATMAQYMQAFPYFHAIHFQMMDFMTENKQFVQLNELRNFDFVQALRAGKRVFAVVVNTDTLRKLAPGEQLGKHWFCMLMDFRALGRDESLLTASDDVHAYSSQACTVEFFDSGAPEPYPSVRAYFNHVKQYFKDRLPRINMWTISVNSAQHQYSHSQCGVYALIYTEMRLKGVPFSYFMKYRITDEAVHKRRSGGLFRRFRAGLLSPSPQATR